MAGNFILIDGSYFCFYRYYAIHNWFKLARKEVELDDPFKNDEFREKFRKTFVDKMKEIPKRLKIEKPIIIVGKDCPRVDIWRNKIYDQYKATRVYDDTFMGGPFFKMANDPDDNLFTKGGAKAFLSHPHLEADDCIAITTKYILEKYPDAHVTIITSDTDYLQLLQPRVDLYTLKFKRVNTEKNSTLGNPDCDLFCKILTGDKSDNIPSVFPKCGIKTAKKMYNDTEEFKKTLEQKNAKAIYERNRTLIDFNRIPDDLVQEFKKECLRL